MTIETPPRVRGRRSRKASFAGMFRNTPACAGKKKGYMYQYGPNQKHPRVCGEEPKKSDWQ